MVGGSRRDAGVGGEGPRENFRSLSSSKLGLWPKNSKKGMGKGGAKSSISPSVRPCTHFILTVHEVKT